MAGPTVRDALIAAINKHNADMNAAAAGDTSGTAPPPQAPAPPAGSDPTDLAALYQHAQELRAQQGLPPEQATPPPPAPNPSLINLIKLKLRALGGGY